MTRSNYKPGHPWYYRLGGKICLPSEILKDVNQASYKGYKIDEITRIDRISEPVRSEKLRALKQQYRASLFRDISIYREYWRVVKPMDDQTKLELDTSITNCPFLALSLKFSHIYNGIAHLQTLNVLLEKQKDLFD